MPKPETTAIVLAPTPEQVAQAKQSYQWALEILMADRRATELQAKHGLVGKCFKCIERMPNDSASTWPVYVAATGIVEEKLVGWHYQHAPTGQIEIATEADLQPDFLRDQCQEIARGEFIATFNELLLAITRYATSVPL